MAASIGDVARRAGVSIATVSRALRGLPDVAEHTRARVLSAATELDYVASPFAARLASGRTATIGVVVPFVDRWFFATVIDAVEGRLRAAGYDLLLYNLGDGDGRASFFERLPVRKRVDAVLIVSLVLTEDEFDALQSLDLPVGLLGITRAGTLSTSIDDVRAAHLAVSHLTDQGHRRIALIGGDTDDPMRFTPPLHRLDGYKQALAEVGVEFDPALSVLGFFTPEGGREAARHLLELDDPPTAIFAESDEMAFGAVFALRAAGRRVPEDIAVMGFDDHAFAELMGLSTIRQDPRRQATDITDRLLRQLDQPAVEQPDAVVIETPIIVRDSTRRPS